MSNFDFDTWAALAASDPQAFEAKRRQALMEAVQQAPADKQAGLTQLVDELCAPSNASPMERIAQSQNQMMGALVRLQQGLVDLVGATAPSQAVARPSAVDQFTHLTVVPRR